MNRPPSIGETIRKQRELNQVSMRQFAEMAGISNPYLSQIERGLREPSERVLEAIAESLETSSEALYEKAGIVGRGRFRDRGGARRDRGRPGPDAAPATHAARGL